MFQNDLFLNDDLDGLGRIDREELKKSIVDLVTNGLFKWEKPWKPVNSDSQFVKIKGKVVSGVINGYSLKSYGRNALMLWCYTKEFNQLYKTNYAPIFVPMSMVRKMGWEVIPREYLMNEEGFNDSCPIMEIFWVKITDLKRIERYQKLFEENKLPYSIIRTDNGDFLEQAYKKDYVVLAENLIGNPLKIERVKVEKAEMIEYIDSIIQAYSSNVAPVYNDQIDRCFYHPKTDTIHLVPPEGFTEINEYYSTRFHETVHSTLHKTRLNRDFGSKKWGDAGYAEEELVAEIGAFMMCSELGVQYYRKDKATPFRTKENSMAYLASWVNVAKELYGDDAEKAIVEAYKYAEKAVDYILKGVDFENMIPQSVKDQENEESKDVLIFENEKVKVIDVRSDERLRIFFSEIPSEDIKKELTDDKFHYSRVFKAWQIKNDKDGKEKAGNFLSKHYGYSKPKTDDDLRKKKIKIKAKALRLRQMQLSMTSGFGEIDYIMY